MALSKRMRSMRQVRTGRIITALVVVAALAIGGHQLYHYQKNQNTLRLKEQAKAAVVVEDWETASSSYRLYLSRKAADAESLRAYVDILLNHMEPSATSVSEASRSLRRLIQLDLDDLESLEKLTALYIVIREHALAEGLAVRWLAADPNSVSAVLALASVKRALHHEQQSAEVLIEAVARLPKAASLYPPLIDLLKSELDDSKEARRWLDIGLVQCPDAYEIHLAAFVLHGRSGDRDEAERHLTLALTSAPNNTRALMAAARYYTVENRPAEARPLLETLTALIPSDRTLLMLRAEWAIKTGSAEDMATAANALTIETGESDPESLAKAAELYVRSYRFSLADESIERLSNAENLTKQQATWLTVLRGARALFDDRPYAALPFLEEAARRAPSHLWTTELLALAYADVGATSEAIDLYRRIAALAPQAITAQRALVRLAARTGQTTELCRWFQPGNTGRDGAAGSAHDDLVRLVCTLYDRRKATEISDSVRAESMVRLDRIVSELEVDGVAVELVERAFVLLGRPDGAVSYAQHLSDEADADPALAALIGHALAKDGHPQSAQAVASILMDRFPDASAGYVLQSRLLAEGDAPADANDFVVASSVSDAILSAMWQTVAEVHVERRRTELALEAVRRAATLKPVDMRILQTLVRTTTDPSEVEATVASIRSIEGDNGLHWRYERAAALVRLERSGEGAGEAVGLLEHCLTVRPGWVAARLLLGYAHEATGAIAEAANSYRRAIAHEPTLGSGEVAIRLVEILKRLGQFGEADAVLDSLAGDYPNTPGVLRLMTERHLRQRNLGSAVATAEQLLKIRRDDPAWAALTADLHTRSGNAERALTIAGDALVEHPGSVSVLRSMAGAMLALKRTEEAQRLVLETAKRQMTPMHHMLVAEVLAHLDQTDEASAAIERALQAGPEDAATHARAAEYWATQGDRGKQLELARKAVLLRGEDPRESLSIAQLLASGRNAEDYSEASAIVDRRLSNNPQDVGAMVLKAKIIAKSDPPDLARAEFVLSEALSADPRSTEAHQVKAVVQAQAGKLSDAGDTIAAGLALGPNDTGLLMAAAEIHSFRGEYREAIVVLRRLLRFRPRTPQALRLLVTAYQKTEQVDRAIELLERSNGTTKRTPSETIMLAHLRETAGELNRAEALFRQAWKETPSSSALFSEYIQYFARRTDLDQVYAMASQRRQRYTDDIGSLVLAGEILAAQSRDPHLRRTGLDWLAEIAEQHPDRAADAVFRMAMSHYQQGDLVNAETMFLKATRMAPEEPRPANGLAWLYTQDRDRPQEALDVIERFLRGGGRENPEMMDTHAAILLKLGRLDEAKSKASDCLNAAGQTATRTAANYRLGLVLLAKGDRDSALTYIRHALDLDQTLGGLTPSEGKEARRLVAPLP